MQAANAGTHLGALAAADGFLHRDRGGATDSGGVTLFGGAEAVGDSSDSEEGGLSDAWDGEEEWGCAVDEGGWDGKNAGCLRTLTFAYLGYADVC